MKVPVSALVLSCVVAAGITYWAMSRRVDNVMARVETLEGEASVQQNDLLGYRRWTSYLTVGKESLGEQIRLLTATVKRDESVTQVLERSVLGFSSTGTVVIRHSVEYSFGYDLRGGQYAIEATDDGITIHVGRPKLVASPAVRDLHYEILSGGIFTDEKAAVLRLYEEASRRAQVEGEATAKDPATVALCEKKLTGFLHDFLAKQPGVRFVPAIQVIYA